MKFIFLNRYFFPDISATSQLLTELATHLAATGREVHVVTSRQRYDAPASRLAAEETADGVRIHRVWTTRFGRATLAGRAIDYLTFFMAAGWRLQRLASVGDVVVAKTDPPLVSIVAAWVARRRGAVLVNWLQDIFPEVAERLGVAWTRGIAGRLARRLRDFSLRAAAVNVVLGERMARFVEGVEGGADGGKPVIKVIHNWSDGARVRPIPPESNALRAEWGLASAFVVGYSGNMGRAHEFETILAAMERLRDIERLAFLFVGGGPRLEWLRREVARRAGDARVMFLDYQPRERLGESLSAADLHLVTLQPQLEGLIVPSKFYGIAAAGRPTLFVGDPDGEIARIVRGADCGYTVQPGDAEGLAAAIRLLLNDPGRRAALGANARRLFEQRFDRSRALTQWDAALGVAAAAGRTRQVAQASATPLD